MVVSFINKQVLRTWGAKLVITFGVDKINFSQLNHGNTQFLFPEKQTLASTEKSLIILHSTLSFNLPLELHACKRVRIWPRYWVYFCYRNPKSGRDLRPRVYGGTSRLWWRWGTRRPCEWGHDLDQKNPSNCRWNRKQICGSKIYPNKFHYKFLNR